MYPSNTTQFHIEKPKSNFCSQVSESILGGGLNFCIIDYAWVKKGLFGGLVCLLTS